MLISSRQLCKNLLGSNLDRFPSKLRHFSLGGSCRKADLQDKIEKLSSRSMAQTVRGDGRTGPTSSPPYMQVTIEDVQVRRGEMAKFYAIIEGNPQPTVAWFKGISLLTDGETVRQFSEDTRYILILYNTGPEDGGVYTCMAKNTEGEVLCKAELVVQEDKKSQEAKKPSTRRKLHAFYEVKQEIGRGSFGFVKRVVHKDNRVPYAAKFIPLRSKIRDQAYQERDILATLSHDRITQLLDQFETRKTLILILELYPFSKSLVLSVKLYIKQLLEGIGYLHSNQILHLDIKPPNILMVYDDRDEIKICDFGFAQRISPAEPQYCRYGSPEFVSPEIISQSPVSTSSDIWPVGVISYLRNDKLHHSVPRARPSAMDCLSHKWFVRSLMSYKSVLVMRPIPDILEKTHRNTSLGVSRHLVEESSSSSSSGSSSDNEISVSAGRRHFGVTPELHLSVLEASDSPGLTAEMKRSRDLLPPIKPTRRTEASMMEEQGKQPRQDSEEVMPLGQKAGATALISSQEKASLLLPEDGSVEKAGDEVGRSPGCVPRHSVIKSTFYGQPPETLANVPSSPGKEHRKNLERAKRTYKKAGYSKSALSGLREPLLEQFEFGEEGGEASGEEETGLFRETGAGPLTKSASFDTAQKSPRVTFHVPSRSRSLDEYRIRAASFAAEQSIEEEESEPMALGSPAEAGPEHPVSEAESKRGSEKTSTEEDSKKGRKEDQPVPSVPFGDGKGSFGAQQQGKALVSTQALGKEESLLPKPKLPLSAPPETPVPETEGSLLAVQKPDLASAVSQKSEGKEDQLHHASQTPIDEKVAPALSKGESSVSTGEKEKALPLSHQKASVSPEMRSALMEGQSPTVPVSQIVSSAVVVPGEKGQKTPPQKPTPPSLTKSTVLEGKGPLISQTKTAPVSATTGESQQLLHQTPATQREVKQPVLEGQGPLHLVTVPVQVSEGGNQQSSAYSDLVSSVLRSASPGIQTASQVEVASTSIPQGENQKGLSPKSSIFSEAKSVLSEAKSHSQQAEHVQRLICEGEHLKHPPQKSFVPVERRSGAFQGQTEPPFTPLKAVPGLLSAGGGQEPGDEKSSVQGALTSVIPKLKTPPILKPSQAHTGLTSPFEAENQELLHQLPRGPREARPVALKAQLPSVQATSPFSVPGGESLATQKKMPASICEGRIMEDIYLPHPAYTDMEAEALEQLVDEMVCLSKEMNVLAESVSGQEESQRHVSPPREMFYQEPLGKGVKPTTRYLIRRGKREGGIGLADPSEADVIYPGEEDYFSMASFLSKRTRMTSGFESGSYYYSGSQARDRMYEIALVQIQDLDDMPRPDSKTAKFDISEVEPAFLNLHELYDIAYYPFEFLSFRKAPEKLPSKRHLPPSEKAKFLPGFKSHLHQDKKICIRDDVLQSDASREVPREEESAPLELVAEPKETGEPRMGKRSDSEGDIPVGAQQMFGLPADTAGKRRSSLQSRLAPLVKPFVRSQSVELVEQSLKQKMKASVTHLSRMLTRKPSPDQGSRESSEERAALTEASGNLKKKTAFPSFTLPSLKTKEKAPSFVEELTDQTIALGQSVTLSCRTSAHSSPHIEWFKDGSAIRSTDRILISSTLKHFQLLTILAAMSGDFGTYACVAANSQGTVSTSCVIRKAEAPSNPPSPDIVEILEDGVQLVWKPVELHTPVTYTVLIKKEDGEWRTLASDITDCCYTAEHLPRGLVCSFRIACVSKAGVGPYSNPSAKVKIGEDDQAECVCPDTEDSETMTAPAQPTHQTYAFQTEIRRGRFSIIKQCREKLSGNPLAAKIIPYRQEDKDAVLQEYHILRKLHHTNIGQLQGAYVSPRHLVLIVELCVGPELLHSLAGRYGASLFSVRQLDLTPCVPFVLESSYSEVEVRDYLWQILSAVEYLHAQNILHLDLRSENMVITEPNLLKLLDFGNAQFYTPNRIITLDGCTDYVETMASELLSDKGAVPQSDIWAVGVTAFIMLSAEYPISPEAACDFGRLVKKDKIKLHKCYAGLSGGAVSFLQSTLSSNPWRRPSASECLQSPWLQETGLDERQQATVTFSTAKLRTFVAERERKRALLCSKYGHMTV
ncbi:hypothetical protein lerEdw1_005998 [Lerista edwardsae]|nr:hypothetical protein lerEdw1_005998 [Lerista edwardsae]